MKLEQLTTEILKQNPNSNEGVELWTKSEKHKTISGISDAIFPARHPRKSSQHVRACAAGDGAICSKNRKIVPYHGANPNTRKDARLRSPSPILAPSTKLALRSPHFKMATNQSSRNCDVITQEHHLSAGGSSGVRTPTPLIYLAGGVDGGCSLLLPRR